jgi:hypothetical protein
LHSSQFPKCPSFAQYEIEKKYDSRRSDLGHGIGKAKHAGAKAEQERVHHKTEKRTKQETTRCCQMWTIAIEGKLVIYAIADNGADAIAHASRRDRRELGTLDQHDHACIVRECGCKSHSKEFKELNGRLHGDRGGTIAIKFPMDVTLVHTFLQHLVAKILTIPRGNTLQIRYLVLDEK